MSGRSLQNPVTLSRRKLIGAASASSLVTLDRSTNPPDETIQLCQAWLAKAAEIGRLQVRWSRHEQWLARRHRWYELTEAEQAALAPAQTLIDLDERMDRLTVDRDAILARLSSARSANLGGVAAKIAIVLELLPREDCPDAHALLARALHDVSALSVLAS